LAQALWVADHEGTLRERHLGHRRARAITPPAEPRFASPNRKRLGRAGTRGLLLAFPRRSRDRTEFGLFQRDWTASDPLFNYA